MTLPASGQISLNDLKTLTGQSALSWVLANTKDRVHDMNSIHGRNYYVRNVDGNCNNILPDQPNNCSYQCTNCVNCYNINCLNCDTQNWLQADCNCGTPYNCGQNAVLYDCPTACADCGSTGG